MEITVFTSDREPDKTIIEKRRRVRLRVNGRTIATFWGSIHDLEGQLHLFGRNTPKIKKNEETDSLDIELKIDQK